MNCKMVALSLFHQVTVAIPPNTKAQFPLAIIVKSLMPRMEAYIDTHIPRKMTMACMLIRYEISSGLKPKRSAATGGSATWYLVARAREEQTHERCIAHLAVMASSKISHKKAYNLQRKVADEREHDE